MSDNTPTPQNKANHYIFAGNIVRTPQTLEG